MTPLLLGHSLQVLEGNLTGLIVIEEPEGLEDLVLPWSHIEFLKIGVPLRNLRGSSGNIQELCGSIKDYIGPPVPLHSRL